MSAVPPADPQHQGLDALQKFQYVPPAKRGVTPVRHARRRVPLQKPGIRRFLPYVAVIWGVSLILTMVIWGFTTSANGWYREGELGAFVVAVAMVLAGGRAIWNRKSDVSPQASFALALVAGVVIAGGVIHWFDAGHSSYPAAVQTEFIANCEGGGASTSGCACALNWFESHESLAQFNAEFAELRATGGGTWAVWGALSSCGVDVSAFTGG